MFIFHVAISDINIPNKKLYACDSKQLFINFFWVFLVTGHDDAQ